MPTSVVQASGTSPGVEHPTSSRPHGGHGHLDLSRIAQDLQIRKVQIENVVQLLDEGNTIPFITRYRKERTGGLNEEVLRTIQERVAPAAAIGRAQADHPPQHRKPGQADAGAARAPFCPPTILAASKTCICRTSPKSGAWRRRRAKRALEPLALAVWHSDPAVSNSRRNPAGDGQSREGTDRGGASAGRRCSTFSPN